MNPRYLLAFVLGAVLACSVNAYVHGVPNKVCIEVPGLSEEDGCDPPKDAAADHD